MSQDESSHQKDQYQFYSQPASNFQSEHTESDKVEWYSQPKVEWSSWSEPGISRENDSYSWSQDTLKPSNSGYTLSQQEDDLLCQALNKYENGGN